MNLRDLLLSAAVLALVAAIARRRPDPNARGHSDAEEDPADRRRRAHEELKQMRNS